MVSSEGEWGVWLAQLKMASYFTNLNCNQQKRRPSLALTAMFHLIFLYYRGPKDYTIQFCGGVWWYINGRIVYMYIRGRIDSPPS